MIKNLTLTNFMSYANAEIPLSPWSNSGASLPETLLRSRVKRRLKKRLKNQVKHDLFNIH